MYPRRKTFLLFESWKKRPLTRNQGVDIPTHTWVLIVNATVAAVAATARMILDGCIFIDFTITSCPVYNRRKSVCRPNGSFV
jgi:uncharacterized membrane protein